MPATEFRVDVFDSNIPRLKSISRDFPKLVRKAVRRTAGHHRNLMKADFVHGRSGAKGKKMLDADGLRSLTSSSTYRGKHAHDSNKPMSGRHRPRLWNALRYKEIAPGVVKFGMITQQASKFLKAMIGGYMMHPRTKVKLDSKPDKDMINYFFNIGLPLTQKTIKEGLEIPKRDMISDYYNRNERRILRDYAKYLEMEYDRYQKRLKSKTRKVS